MSDRLTLQFSTSTAWESGVIRLLTKSEFSHVDVVVPVGTPGLEALMPKDAPYGLLGASDPGGVMIRRPDYQPFRLRRRMTLVTDKADAILDRVASQIGKPFDHDSLKRTFDLNWSDEWQDTSKWYCVELVVWALLTENFFDNRSHPVVVSTSHLTPQDAILLLAGEFDPKEFANDYYD